MYIPVQKFNKLVQKVKSVIYTLVGKVNLNVLSALVVYYKT